VTRLSLSTVAWILGAVIIGLRLPGIIWPDGYGRALRKFPRHFGIGAVLAAVAAVWIAWYLYHGVTGTWAWFKPYALAAVPVGYVVSLKYLDDYLAVRALAVLLLLVAKPLTDAARWHSSQLSLVVTVVAYVMVIAGMIYVVSPYRLRDGIEWSTRTPGRTRWICAVGTAVGLFICLLAGTVYRIR
jgi:hypothetical protein